MDNVTPTSRTLPNWAYAAGLVLLCLLVYYPTFTHGFIWDDDDYVENNTTLRDLPGLVDIWVTPSSTPQYYPLVFTALWLEYQAWGDWAGGYHIVNVLLQAINAVLLWIVLSRLKIPGAWVVAACFAIHPVHVETVAWISEHKNLMSGCFYFAAAICYFKCVNPDGVDEPKPWQQKWYWLAMFWFLLALLSKTVVATLPAAILLIVWWKRGRLVWRDVLPTLPFFVIGIAMGLVTAARERSFVGAEGAEWDLSFAERLIVAGRLSWFYAWKLIWPVDLSFNYERWPIDASNWLSYLWPLSVLVTLGLLWAFRKRIGRGPLVGLLFFGGSLFPALGFLNVFPFRYAWAADHFQYLASLGVICVVIGCRAYHYNKGPRQKVAMVAATLMLVVLAALSWSRTHVFANVETLWTDTLKRNPDSYLATTNLAVVRFQQGQYRQVEAMARRALELTHTPFEAYDLLAAVYHLEGREEEALAYYVKALELQPGDFEIRYNVASLLHEKGEYQQAVGHLENLIKQRPDAATPRYQFGRTLVALGRTDEAIEQLELACNLLPNVAKSHEALAEAYEKAGRADDAIVARKKATNIHIANADQLAQGGVDAFAAGQIVNAANLWNAALVAHPDHELALRRLAWLLATFPDDRIRNSDRALELSERLIDRSQAPAPGDQIIRAAALAEAGQFEDALQIIATLEKNDSGRQSGAGAVLNQLRESFANNRAVRSTSPPPGRS